MLKKARPIAELLRKDVPRPRGEWHLCPMYGPPSAVVGMPASQTGETLMFSWTYTPMDLHPAYDSRDRDEEGKWEGIEEFYALLLKRCRLNRRKATAAMDAFNKWWDKQRDAKAAVKAIWG